MGQDTGRDGVCVQTRNVPTDMALRNGVRSPRTMEDRISGSIQTHNWNAHVVGQMERARVYPYDQSRAPQLRLERIQIPRGLPFNCIATILKLLSKLIEASKRPVLHTYG